MKPRARPHPVPLIAGLAVVLITALLGNWQTQRAAEKTARQATFASAGRMPPQALSAADPGEWQLVELHGRWEGAQNILVDNRVHAGRPGYHVLTPLQVDGRALRVLVNRGWIAAPAERAQLPVVPVPAGHVAVVGRVRYLPERSFMLGADAGGPAARVWQALDRAHVRQWGAPEVAAFYLQQTSPAPDGLVRDWPDPDAGVDRHRGYALQWYALALLATALTAFHVWKTMWSFPRDTLPND